MATGIPARDATDLYNKLLRIPFSAKAEIGQIAWRLRRSWRQDDIESAAAYLQAIVMLGDANECRVVAQNIWDRRFHLTTQAAYTYAMQLNALGWYERALELVDGIITKSPDTEEFFRIVRMHAFVWLGDLDSAGDLSQSYLKNDWPIEDLASQFDTADFSQYFANHQRIVRGVVSNVQCGQQPIIARTDAGLEFQQEIYISGDRATCREFEERIDTALAEYYLSVGADEAAHAPWLVTSVRDMTSHWQLLDDERDAA